MTDITKLEQITIIREAMCQVHAKARVQYDSQGRSEGHKDFDSDSREKGRAYSLQLMLDCNGGRGFYEQEAQDLLERINAAKE